MRILPAEAGSHESPAISKIPAIYTIALIVLLICLYATATARAAGEYRIVETEGLRIIVDSEWAPRGAPGYLPVRFDITNRTDARIIEIVGHGSRFFVGPRGGGAPGALNILQAVRLARGDRVRLTVPIPIMADSENIQFEIREDGRTLERLNYSGFQGRAPASEASVLIVADPSSPFGVTATSWRRLATYRAVMVGPGARTPGAAPSLDFLLEPARLPTSWLGYTSLRAVLIDAREWEQLTGSQKSALLTWTACGGDLMIVDGNLDAVFPGVPGTVAFSPGLIVRAYFFGRIHVPTSVSISNRGLASILADAAKVQDQNWGLPANRTVDWGAVNARGFRLAIPGVAGVPARAYLSILVVFAIVIGPVNYWFLRLRRQQVLLVLTTPLISAIFIVLLAGYVVAGEGLGVSGRAVTFTMLDQVRKQSATRTSASLYAAGMTPGGGLRFGRDLAVFAIGPEGSGSRESYTLDLTAAQRFSSGVIQARSPANIEQIAFRSARERVMFSPEGSGMSAINGLDATITALVYRRGNTTYTLGGPLAPGVKAVLTARGNAAAPRMPFDLPLYLRFEHLFAHQPEGSYLAVLERSPFWDPGMANIHERGSFHLVIGWPAGQP